MSRRYAANDEGGERRSPPQTSEIMATGVQGGCMLNLTDQNIAGSTAHLVTLQLNIPRNTSQYQLDILLGIFQLWFI